jgi:serine-type D-Ala-D-Ala carboxypeptidase (penicillin-binding protein 5/6)
MTKRIVAIAGVLLALGLTAGVAVLIWQDRHDGGTDSADTSVTITNAVTSPLQSANGPTRATAIPSKAGVYSKLAAPPIDHSFLLAPAVRPLPVHLRQKHPPAAGVLFDVKSGQILWVRHADQELPIASLTKMMTALIVAQQDPASQHVAISKKAAHTPGSATGLLPMGRKVPLEPLLQALIMISANDAAIALAQHDAGTVQRFIKEMNQRAAAMGLSCTHFSTPNGLRDRNNHSCPLDLAALARADLANPRIARIAQTDYARPRFPIKGHRLNLANNHYFLDHGLAGVPGAQVTGLKTGFTDAAGRCYVTTARLGGHQLGVVLLDSPNPLVQVPALLRAGFIAVGALSPATPSPPSKH